MKDIQQKNDAFYSRGAEQLKDSRGFTPFDYYDILSEIWCAETCAPRMRGEWSEQNKTCGQCSITAFLMQDIYGGKVYGIPLGDGNYHCFNVVGESVFDLTSAQFGKTVLDYESRVEQSRQTHFSKAEKQARYACLAAGVERFIAINRQI